MSNKKELFENPTDFHAEIEKLQNEGEKVEAEENVEASPEEPTEEVSSEEDNIEVNAEEETEAENDNEEDYKEKKFIPKSRLNKEIKKRNELEEALQKEKEDKIRFETQFQYLQQQLEKLNQQPDNQNVAQEDGNSLDNYEPLDGEAHQIYLKKIEELENKISNLGQNTDQQTKQLQYFNVVNAQEQQFQKTHPDFNNALDHLKNIETKVAQTFYSDPQQAQNYVQQKLQSILVNAVENGQNAPEIVYNLAQTYGYTPDAAPVSTPKSNIHSINHNQKRSASIHGINNKSGVGNNGNVGINDLLNDPSNPNSGINASKFHEQLKKINHRSLR